MVDFTALRATTKSLIDANGRYVTIRQQSNTPSDSAEPWNVAEPSVVASVSGSGVFVTDKTRGGIALSIAQSTIDGMKTSNAVVLFAAADDGGYSLEDFHEIVDGSRVWRIIRVEVLQPASDRLLYFFEVE